MEYDKLRDMSRVVGEMVNMSLYEQLKHKKLVDIKKHPNLALTLLNYSSLTQMKKKWNSELLQARGLVVDDGGLIIARPLPKFFNHYEIKGHIPSDEIEVYEKLDGSLIIMAFFNGEPFFCTRGSFTSEQAIKAEEIYFKKYKDLVIDQDYTYCFEVIYPQNKIVIDYDKEEDLFLLAKINTKTGMEESIYNCGLRCVSQFEGNKTIEELKAMEKHNEEGFVVKFPQINFRMKIKFKNYIEQHKFGKFSRERIINLLRLGKELPLSRIPDECYSEIRIIYDDVIKQFKNIEKEVLEEYETIKKTEKDIVEKIKLSSNPALLFTIHRGGDYKKRIWKNVK